MDKIIILDFGGQYCHLIARRIRDLGVYAQVLPAKTRQKELAKVSGLKGLVLSGGAASVYAPSSPKLDSKIFSLKIPVLGICYGHQLIASTLGGKVVRAPVGEYGTTQLTIIRPDPLLAGLNKQEKVWMNHKDVVIRLPAGFLPSASTADSKIAAFFHPHKKIYGVQFHPEVTHTKKGAKVLANFIFNICGAKKEHKAGDIIQKIIKHAKQTIGHRRAIIGLSGGVDSSVAAVLAHKAIGKNLVAVYVDTGLMRAGETDFIKQEFSKYSLNLKIIKAQKKFFQNLKGVTSPEAKRKIIGKTFIDIFNQQARQQKAEVLIQGTIYSDRIESGVGEQAAKIKSHHNVGGLPKNMKLEVYEPLKDLYKDEVRILAKKLCLPRQIIYRHVFPGPGLAIRIIGEVTKQKVEIVRQAHLIIEEVLGQAKLWPKLWMAFAVLLPIKSVGIQGDARSYKYPLVVRIIESEDAMTAKFAKIPYQILEKISTRITNEIPAVNRVVYDITNKPPATMEWE